MKQFYLLFAFLLTGAAASAQVYVDADATGSNDGSSWANAYTSLVDALADTTVTEIWVAAGTYTPGTDTLDAFVINRQVDLYGGFAGTETTVLERNPDANVTILSADLEGDDTPGDFDEGRDDNALHVIYVDSLILDPVVIDGFTISGGNANDFVEGLAGNLYRGGGVYALSAVAIRSCIFTDNRAGGGAAAYIAGEDADGSSIESSEFYGNLATNSGIVFFNSVIGILVDNSQLYDNETVLGTLLVNNSAVAVIENSRVENNVNPVGSGAGIYLFNSAGILVLNDTIVGNQATGSSGGLYIRATELVLDEELVEVENCLIQDNVCGSWGGGAYCLNQSATFRNTTFSGNSAQAGLGGGMATSGGGLNFVIDSCFFIDNVAARGGGLSLDDSLQYARVTNTDFENNTAVGNAALGGAVYLQAYPAADFVNCMFDGNVAPVRGGGICLLSSLVVNVDSCTFANNATTDGGGGVYIQDELSVMNISNSSFTDNESATRGGGIYHGFGSTLTVTSSFFSANSAVELGGALYTQNDGSPVSLATSTFNGNLAGSTGGALMSLGNSSFIVDSCVFQGNQAVDLGGAIDFRLAAGTTEFPADTVIIEQSTFTLNLVDGEEAQASVLFLSNFHLDFVNNLVADNIVNEDALNGPISINASQIEGAFTDMVVDITNNTIVNNAGTPAAGVAVYQDPDASTDSVALTVTLTNNLLSSPFGPVFVIEDGTPDVISGGGNFITDNSFDTIAVASDIVDLAITLEELVTDPTELDYRPLAESPLVDAGVTGPNVPTVDITGNSRDEMPDIGAFEFEVSSVDEEVVSNAGQLKVMPNPVHLDANLQLNNDWTGKLQVRIYDLNGRAMQQSTVTKVTQQQLFPVNVSMLPAGQYFVLVSNGEQAVVEKLIKR